MLVSHHWRSVYSNYTMYVLYGICYIYVLYDMCSTYILSGAHELPELLHVCATAFDFERF